MRINETFQEVQKFESTHGRITLNEKGPASVASSDGGNTEGRIQLNLNDLKMIKNSFEEPHRRLNSGERGMKMRDRLNSLNATDVLGTKDNPVNLTHYAIHK